MNYFEIKYVLAKKGYSLAVLAYELGLAGPQAVKQVLTRQRMNSLLEKRVSEITGLPLEELFPDRYPSQLGHRVDDEILRNKTHDND